MEYLKLLKKFFYILCISLLIWTAGVATLSYLYKDQIIAHFVEKSNSHLNRPVDVGKIDFSWFDKFPYLNITLDKVVIKGLVEAEKIDCLFNPFNLLQQNYKVSQVHINNGTVNLNIDKNGKPNYFIFEQKEATQGGKLSFAINKIVVEDIEFHFQDQRYNHNIDIGINAMKASLRSTDNIYEIRASGDFISHSIAIQGRAFLLEKSIIANAELIYDDNKKSLNIDPSALQIEGSDFTIAGDYILEGNRSIDLSLSGEDTNIATILSLLPKAIAEQYASYQSEGDVYFSAKLAGPISERSSPGLKIDFGSSNASIYHAKYKKRLEQVSLVGQFSSKSVNDLSTATLALRDVHGQLDGKNVDGNLTISNFDDYHLDGAFKLEANIKSIFQLFPVDQIKSIDGLAKLDLSYKGRLQDLQKRSRKISASGNVFIENLNLSLKGNPLAFSNLSGDFVFNNNDVAINNLTGKIGNSDVKFNGIMHDLIPYILFKNQNLSINARLFSDFVDGDEIIGAIQNAGGDSEQESAKITKQVKLKLHCDIKRLKYKRFDGHALKGGVTWANQILTTNNLATQVAGGSLLVNATINSQIEDNLRVRGSGSLKGIYLDSMFYVFKDFNQTFLEQRHLKGQIYTDVRTSMEFGKKLRFKPEKLNATISASIKNGELNNFEPMRQVAKYVKGETLEHLTFSELKNDIVIQNLVIHLPQMEVKSNVTSIDIQGTHSFNKLINYHLKVPIKSLTKKDREDAFGPVKDDGLSEGKVLLRIHGTTDDYIVSLDQKAIKEKAKEDIKKEGVELKETFKTHGLKDKKQIEEESIELNEDEYFDFEEDSVDVN